jgi:molybdopterin-containing oxidoreductase family membrane subunit
MCANVFFILLEVFTAFYSGIPGHMHAFEYLFAGIEGYSKLVPLMWISAIFAIISLIMLIPPGIRNKESNLVKACVLVFISLWIDKGFGLVIGGFIPNHFGTVTEYWPTLIETIITLGVWAIGFLTLTILYKVAISVREELGTAK